MISFQIQTAGHTVLDEHVLFMSFCINGRPGLEQGAIEERGR